MAAREPLSVIYTDGPRLTCGRLAQTFGILSFTVAAILFVGCGATTGVVPTGPHLIEHEGEPLRVSRPPPPVQVEAIPLRRNDDCFYMDGAWVPDGGGWKWEKGRWVLTPLDCYFAPPITRYEEFDSGTALVFRPGVWHSRSGSSCPDARECPAAKGK